MLTSLEVVGAFGVMCAIVLFTLVLFRSTRANPKSILVRSEFLASMTAVLITTLLVVSWTLLGIALHHATGDVAFAFIGAVSTYLTLALIGWRVMVTPVSNGAPAGLGRKLPGAPA